jgi:carboxymethylenebutenolidase
VAQSARDALAAVDVLKAHPAVDASKLAATGYCAGGAVTGRLSTLSPDLRAAAPFYGSNPPIGEVPHIRAAIFGVYGELDERLNEGIPAVEAAMQAAGTMHQIKVYPDSLHGFHGDGSPAYNPVTAPEAWRDTLQWFAQHLGLPTPRL